jgi:hypothetical protein
MPNQHSNLKISSKTIAWKLNNRYSSPCSKEIRSQWNLLQPTPSRQHLPSNSLQLQTPLWRLLSPSNSSNNRLHSSKRAPLSKPRVLTILSRPKVVPTTLSMLGMLRIRLWISHRWIRLCRELLKEGSPIHLWAIQTYPISNRVIATAQCKLKEMDSRFR